MAIRHDPLIELGKHFLARGEKVVTAESCTGGLLASAFTSVPGSSTWFEGSFITYSNAAKHRMLGIPVQVIDANGAVSERVALEMVTSAVRLLGATLGVSVTGLAGPDGDGSDTPVGTVWIGIASKDSRFATSYRFVGSRDAIRETAVRTALETLLETVRKTPN